MQNDSGEYVDSYIPRKCTASNRIIGAKDHASIQISLAELDAEKGTVTGKKVLYDISGDIRKMGESDDCINRLALKDKMLTEGFFRKPQ